MIPTCTINEFRMQEEEREDLPEWFATRDFNHERWFSSRLYRGSIVVPADFEMTDDYRRAILRCTESYMAREDVHAPVIYALPGCEREGLVPIRPFFN